MLDKKMYDSQAENSWCPGCGNFPILATLKETLAQLELAPDQVMIVSGIGQAAKLPHFIRANGFNGLHGRALPAAFGAKVANKEMTVIVHSGDGDTYGEGGNHLIHNIRRNIDIAHFVHNNQVYGLTKGQGSPTTARGQETTMQYSGVKLDALNPLALAIALDCSFVARAFAGDKEHLASMMQAAITHRGYAMVDILQPCVSFNKVNTYQWYNQRVYHLDESYDPTDKVQAFSKALEWDDTIPIGIIYQHDKSTYLERLEHLANAPALINRKWTPADAKPFIKHFS